MSKRRTRTFARYLSVVLVLALLVLVSGFASAQPRSVTTFFIQEAKLTASDGAEGDYFGGSVSISDDTLVVGASLAGSAYVFERDEGGPGNWGQVAKLAASDAGDGFGWSVSISGDTVVAGASADDDNGDASGSAYLFEMPGSGWTDMNETAKLTASDGAEGDRFGGSVSISGDSVVVGAFWDDDNGLDSGSAYVFAKPETGWTGMTETAKLTASDGLQEDNFGRSVSISGDTVVVGAFLDDDSGSASGSAYVFEKPETGWIGMNETARLTASGWTPVDLFGYSVSISGDTVVIGAWGDDDSGNESGSAYVFEKPGTGWTAMNETAKLTASDGAEGDRFGESVSISGDNLVVGVRHDDDSGSDSGSAYLFEKPGTGWTAMTETAKLTASDGAQEDFLGISVSISGDTVVVGAYRDDDDGDASGSAYVFGSFEPVVWVYLPVVLRSAP